MTKNEYLKQLDKHLKHVTKEDRQDVLAEYETHFISGQEDGKSEEEIARELGNPKQLARELNATLAVESAKSKGGSKNIGKAILAVMGLSLLNFFIVLVPAFFLLMVLVGLVVIGFTLLMFPVFLIVKAVNPEHGPVEHGDIYITIASIGVLMMLIVILIVAVKWLSILFIKYLKWNIHVVKGSASA